MARGGPQRIPRPENAVIGDDAPWAHLEAGERVPSLGRIESAIMAFEPTLLGTDRVPRYESAVLVPLYEHRGEPYLVLTRRAPHMRTHTHQVAFPGGRADPTDRDLWHTAVREAHEEIDLDPGLPRRIGALDRFVTAVSDSLVHPEVAVLPERPELRASPAEVEHILHVPVAELLDDEVFREERWQVEGSERSITFFELHGDTVWGATASILRQFLTIVTGVADVGGA